MKKRESNLFFCQKDTVLSLGTTTLAALFHFQSDDLTVNTTRPDLTHCLQQTAITWGIYGLCIILNGIYLIMLRGDKTRNFGKLSTFCRLKLVNVSLSYTVRYWWLHYGDVIMGTMASQITSLTIVYSTVYSGADQRKHQSSASLASVRGIHWGPVNSPHKWPVTRKMFPFDDVIMIYS